VKIQQRLIYFITRANWIIYSIISIGGLVFAPADFARGIVLGGLIVTVNFYLLAKTLDKALTPPHLAPHRAIIAKYYVRFIICGIIIFFLISQKIVNPLGLIIGLSVVVASIMLATLCELKRLISKEAV
jgi:hypothetical protein